ncbi:MAG: hypothetical protein ACYCST_21235, partial [Acidimicrobiales bacterium]
YDTVNITNEGAISAISAMNNATGVSAVATSGDSSYVGNSGSITVQGQSAIGVYADAPGSAGTATVTNSSAGTIAVTGVTHAIGIDVGDGLHGIANNAYNAGTITVVTSYGDNYSTGITAIGMKVGNGGFNNHPKYNNSQGSVTATNSGSISVTSDLPTGGVSAFLYGIFAYAKNGNVTVTNSGGISVQGEVDFGIGAGEVKGIYADTKYGGVSVTNSGDITVVTGSSALGSGGFNLAFGIQTNTIKYGSSGASVDNSGHISATGWEAAGIASY